MPEEPLHQPAETVEVPSVEDLEAGGKVPCPMCWESIKPRARICIHCKSDLTWKRFLPGGFAPLATAVTTLLAVSVALGPQLVRLYGTQEAEIHAAVVGTGPADGPLVVLASNDGTKKGVLEHAAIVIPFMKRADQPPNRIDSVRLPLEVIPDGMATIDPGTTQTVKLAWEKSRHTYDAFAESFGSNPINANFYFMEYGKIPEHKQCTFIYFYVKGSGGKTADAQSFDCSQIINHIKEMIEQSKASSAASQASSPSSQ